MKRVLALLVLLTFACRAGIFYDPLLSRLVTTQSAPSYSTVTITDAGTITFNDDGDDTTVVFGPVGDGTTILGVTGTINATGLQVGGNAVLTAEADTLATVSGRGATSAESLTLTGATPLTLGADAATNTAGWLKLWGAGANDFYTTITAGTQTQVVAYTLPADDGDAGEFLKTDGNGALSWTHTVNTYSAPVALTYAADCTPDCADGLLRKCTLTGNIEINPPSNPAEGMKWECWLTCDASARTLTLDAAILVPTESTVSWPKTLVANKTFILMLKYNGSKWMLASLVGAY